MNFRLLGTSCLCGILIVLVPCAAAPNQEAKDALDLPQSVIFAVRPYGPDGHYYANFGYYCDDPTQKAYSEGGRLCRLDVATGRVIDLLNDPHGGVRDPQMHYDGRKVLFSYRPGGTEYYHLYEIGADGQELRQLTDGPFDDIEPTYLPGGDIAFCSSRCNRWVACWKVPVAILYRCDGRGKNIHMLSSNAVTENTPVVLGDGRLLYTRWEYNDRSQLAYHHLWTMNPDGTGQMTFFGNMFPTGMSQNIASRSGSVVTYDNVPGAEAMLDAQPIPGTGSVVAIFSPGHGRREHQGFVTIVNPRLGPDHPPAAHRIHPNGACRDPYPLSSTQFLVARNREIHVLNRQGGTRLLYELDDPRSDMMVHEPVPVRGRPREPVVADASKEAETHEASEATGKMVLADVALGRNMEGVRAGDIRKLLVLEQLPAPFHVSPGFDGISVWGPFTITRILGTVPVEPDGSAFFEAPAMRSLFFVALDVQDLSVKKMQSFVTLQPGEVRGCVGCHEQRNIVPPNPDHGALLALQRPVSQIEPIPDAPQIVDFRRHIQPILDRHCVSCHGPQNPDGDICLDGAKSMGAHGRGRVPRSYVALVHRLGEVADGRNAHGNRSPRTIGSSASKLMSRIDGNHFDVVVSPREATLVRLWLDSGAVANGTYAIMDGGTPETPSPHYIREMRRYGILPPQTKEPIDVYATDEAYWRSFWYQGQTGPGSDRPNESP